MKLLAKRRDRRVQRQADRIVEVLALDPARRWWTADLARLLDIQPAEVMVALARLERHCVVASGWLEGAPGCPRRRWYRHVGGDISALNLDGDRD